MSTPKTWHGFGTRCQHGHLPTPIQLKYMSANARRVARSCGKSRRLIFWSMVSIHFGPRIPTNTHAGFHASRKCNSQKSLQDSQTQSSWLTTVCRAAEQRQPMDSAKQWRRPNSARRRSVISHGCGSLGLPYHRLLGGASPQTNRICAVGPFRISAMSADMVGGVTI